MTLRMLVAFLMLTIASLAAAQEQSGILQGKVVDASGAVMPGVTVTVSGPGIIGGSRATVTGERGTYRVTNIPIGTYSVTFELPGFRSQAYQDVRVQANAAFTVDAELEVGEVQETVTVAGASPVIDTGTTNVAFTFNKELMDSVPNAGDPWAMVIQAPGVVAGGINVGGTQTGNQVAFTAHGGDSRQNIYLLNGANITDNTNNGGAQFYFDVDSFQEMEVQINSHSADVHTPGIVLNIIQKSGTNSVHGSGSFRYGNDSIQSNNVDEGLRALGVNRASNLHKYLDAGFDVGGPIITDKLWFWGAHRYQEVQNFITGTTNPDGSFPIDRTVLWYPSAKIDWKISAKHNFVSTFNMSQKKRFGRGLSALRPIETSWDQQNKPKSRLFTFRDDWILSSNWLFSFKANVMDQGFELRPQEGVDVLNTPARLDIATGLWSDAPPNTFGIAKNMRSVGVTAIYHVGQWLGGEHEFKFGFDISSFRAFGNQGGGVAVTTYPADHRLLFFNGTPFEVILFGPGAQSVLDPTRSAFAMDSWKLGRMTLNLGARWDWQANSLLGVTAPESRFFAEPVIQEETGNLVEWNSLAPRLGVIYDITGNAKTLLKASFSRYYWHLWVDKGTQASLAGDRSFTYLWNDPNGDRKFTIEELGTLVAVDDPATRPVTIDENLKPTSTDEITAGIVRELMPNVSATATYMYRKDKDLDWRITPAISPSDYATVIGRDPGLDGQLGTTDDGEPLAFYEIAAAKATLSPNFITTRAGFTTDYHGLELAVSRRMSNNWQMVGSLTTGVQRENYGPGSFQNPQDIDKIDDTRIASSVPYIAKLIGSYRFPHDIAFSGFYQYRSGTNFTRTVNSLSALGRRLNQGNVVAVAGRRNEESYGGLNLLDLRVAYDLPIRKARAEFAVDFFNVLNINTITSRQTLSGSAFGRVLDFIPPRIVRFGVKLRF